MAPPPESHNRHSALLLLYSPRPLRPARHRLGVKDRTLKPAGVRHPKAFFGIEARPPAFGFSTFVIEPSLTEQPARTFFGHGNLLVARVKITTYN